jgi:hypothetical protein
VNKIHTSYVLPNIPAGYGQPNSILTNENNQKKLIDINSDDESINLLSDSILKISEKNESLEMSLALDESYIKRI